MNFLNGYIVAIIVVGVFALLNDHLNWQINAWIIISPVMAYVLLSLIVLFFKQSK